MIYVPKIFWFRNSFLSPKNGSSLPPSGGTYGLTIEWTATDSDQGINAEIDRVEIFVEGVFIKEYPSNETSVVIQLDNGSHTIHLNAFDPTVTFLRHP